MDVCSRRQPTVAGDTIVASHDRDGVLRSPSLGQLFLAGNRPKAARGGEQLGGQQRHTMLREPAPVPTPHRRHRRREVG
jgi:hypothetical protein